jgi:hypothetical protein
MSYLTTEQLAKALNLKPASLRSALCTRGSYYGVTPVKMPNRQLLWPSDALARLTPKTEGGV